MNAPLPYTLLISPEKGRLFRRMLWFRSEMEGQGLNVKHWVASATGHAPPGCVAGSDLMGLLAKAKTVMMTPGEVSEIMPLVFGYRHALGMSPPLFYGYRPDKTPRMKSVCPEEAWGEVVEAEVALTRLLREGGREQEASVDIAAPGAEDWSPWEVYVPNPSDRENIPHTNVSDLNAFRRTARLHALFKQDAEAFMATCIEGTSTLESSKVALAMARHGTDDFHAKLSEGAWAWVFRDRLADGLRDAAIARGGLFAQKFGEGFVGGAKQFFTKELEASRGIGEDRVLAALAASKQGTNGYGIYYDQDVLSPAQWDLLSGKVKVANPLEADDDALAGRATSLGFWLAAMRYADSPVQLISQVARRLPKRFWGSSQGYSALPQFIGLYPPRSLEEFTWWENLIDPREFGRRFSKIIAATILGRWPYLTNRLAAKASAYSSIEDLAWDIEPRIEDGPVRDAVRRSIETRTRAEPEPPRLRENVFR